MGAVSPAIAQPDGRQRSAPKDSAQAGRAFRLVVSLVGFRRIPLDDDNYVGACKALRDSISKSLGLDDGDKRLKWQYSQVQTSGEEGVLVRIELVKP